MTEEPERMNDAIQTETQTGSAPQSLQPGQVEQLLNERSALLVDVREVEEFEFEHIPGSLLMPLSTIDHWRFPRCLQIPVITVCQIGKRSAEAAARLREDGVTNVAHLEGGINAWKAAGLDLDSA